MITLLRNIFLVNWPRKVIAIIAAIVIWFLVSHSITLTRTIPNIPVRVLNIPADKTVEGLLPNGLLAERLTLTLTGSRSFMSNLQGQDLEVVTDAAGRGDRWSIEVTKRNLVGRTPDVNVAREINSVSPLELTIQLSPLVSEKIPITVARPIGEPPKGYLYLDIWPQRLYQTVKGPKSKIDSLKEKGLTLTFNLSDISKAELKELQAKAEGNEEIRFFVPEAWKRVSLPFGTEGDKAINDPEAAYLHIDFLLQDLLPLDTDVPVTLFFPLNYSLALNPDTYSLEAGPLLTTKNGLFVLKEPLYVQNVSRRFLETVRDNFQLTFKAVPADVSDLLPWSVEFIDPTHLEEQYVRASLPRKNGEEEALSSSMRVKQLRERFRKYLRDFKLLRADHFELQLYAELGAEAVTVTDTDPRENPQ